MIPGVTCRHCARRDGCTEDPEMGIICRSFREDWQAIEADPAVRRQGRAAKKRERRRIRGEIAALTQEANNDGQGKS